MGSCGTVGHPVADHQNLYASSSSNIITAVIHITNITMYAGFPFDVVLVCPYIDLTAAACFLLLLDGIYLKT